VGAGGEVDGGGGWGAARGFRRLTADSAGMLRGWAGAPGLTLAPQHALPCRQRLIALGSLELWRTWQKGETSQRPVNVRMKPPSRALWNEIVRFKGCRMRRGQEWGRSGRQSASGAGTVLGLPQSGPLLQGMRLGAPLLPPTFPAAASLHALGRHQEAPHPTVRTPLPPTPALAQPQARALTALSSSSTTSCVEKVTCSQRKRVTAWWLTSSLRRPLPLSSSRRRSSVALMPRKISWDSAGPQRTPKWMPGT
jgi:hypothetical protein